MIPMSRHLVLLGDSIFDNAAYVPGCRPAVIDQVRNRLPPDWQASLLASDGSVIKDVHRQLRNLPSDATHLVVSAGGNDVLFEIGLLGQAVETIGEGLRLLAESRDRFDDDYRRLLQALRDRGLLSAVCTIYNPSSPDALFQREAETALSLFNDCIIGNARRFRLPVLELRVVCTAVADFVNEIEPSVTGGAKIAQAICQEILERGFGQEQTVLLP
jgi:hypothetical protein